MQPRIFLNSTFVGTLCGLSLFIGVFTAPKPASVPNTLPEFPVNVGDPSPQERWCNWTYMTGMRVYCQAYMAGQDVFYTRDLSTNTVASVTYDIEDLDIRIGDLILKWGTPTAQTRSGSLRRVWWGTRSVLVHSPTFTPHSVVWYLSFSSDLGEGSPWRGFSR